MKEGIEDLHNVPVISSIKLEFDREPFSSSDPYRVHWKSRKIYQRPEFKEYKKNILIEALSQMPVGYQKMTGFIEANITFYFKHPSSFSKSLIEKIKNPEYKIHKATKPDLQDNLNKPIFDALEHRFYEHDSQICIVHSEKLWWTKSKIVLELFEF